MVLDALGRQVQAPDRPLRIVSLVPSLTELLFALGCGDRVAGVSRYCLYPEAEVACLPRVGGQKDPDLGALLGLQPDLVLANKEENLERDVAALERAGVPVYVTDVRTLPAALALPREIGGLCAADPGRQGALQERMEQGVTLARERACQHPRVAVAMPVWRDPWILAGSDTYIDAVLSAIGGDNVATELDGAGRRRYPKADLAQLRGRVERVLLPSEPYPFGERDAAEVASFLGVPARLCDGTVACWYGPRTARIAELSELLWS